ncbi:MAG: Hsp33 family molecular chaperone HslO [Methylotenera sp.]|nr:Hsp33 family molecular chaperone HslO [Methylotenera sp.]MDO9232944.1 Hsp33 family molecular chaperone HslO [Methylotenera sp.]MDO9388851.1 Hsp33 family molecular chaperone HslO [Methylotenera sp.]MDP2102252.1 Hsp33 family molecular chaperone HslO [Methylotenera sp.]MDP2281212.1 Hsp33 family molecular chaperone HslO [Methylotenera sp.]
MKNDQDTLQRFVFENTPVRGNLVNLTSTFQLALNKQSLPSGLRQALGELMAASALLTATLKMNGSLVLQIQSKGLLKLLVVECNSDFGIRATAKWTGEVNDQQSLFDLIEHGQFMITLDPKDGGQAYQGIVPLEGDSISAILENYMLRSEQIDTKIWLCCDGNSAAGMLLQKLPDTMNQITQSQEHSDHDLDTWNRVGHLASTITDDELLNLPTETLLKRLFNEEDIRLFEASHTAFFCSCSRESVANMLRMLGPDELSSIIEEQGQIEVNCDFCNTHYKFDKIDAVQLLVAEVTTPSSLKVH